MRGKVPERRPVWLVWATSTSGLTSLCAVDDEQWIADVHRRALAASERYLKVWCEKSETNHMYDMTIEPLTRHTIEMIYGKDRAKGKGTWEKSYAEGGEDGQGE